jgi:hypothetical protein
MDINSSMWPIFTRMSAVPLFSAETLDGLVNKNEWSFDFAPLGAAAKTQGNERAFEIAHTLSLSVIRFPVEAK